MRRAPSGREPTLWRWGLVAAPGGGFRRSSTGRALPAVLKAAAQPLHQVDHLRLSRLRLLFERDALAFEFAFDDAYQILAVLIGVFRRIPGRGKALNERLRHLNFRFAKVLGGRKLELRDLH